MEIRDALQELVTRSHRYDGLRIYGDPPNFDVICRPGSQEMEVQLRIQWRFDGEWAAGDQQQFKQKYLDQIDKYWSERYRLKLHIDPVRLFGPDCREAAYSYSILPRFSVNEAPNQHYTIRVLKSTYERSFVMGGECTLFRTTADEYQPGLYAQMQHRQGILGKLANRFMPIPGVDAVTHFKAAEGKIDFVRGSQDYTAAGQAHVDRVVDILRQELPTFELVKIDLTGYSIRGEDAALSLARVNKVRRDLIARGAPAIQLRARDGGVYTKLFGTPTGHVALKLEDNPRERLVAEAHPWPVAAHEFGHMIGLLDEYCPEGDDQIQAVFPLFQADCRRFGATFPRFGVRGTSLMSWGYHVYPCHYVPLAKALCHVIDEYAWEAYPRRRQDQEARETFRAGLSVSIDPLPMKPRINETEEVNYLDWINGTYHRDA